MATTVNIPIQQLDDHVIVTYFDVPLAAGLHALNGEILCENAAGLGVHGDLIAGANAPVQVLGICTHEADNTGGAAGSIAAGSVPPQPSPASGNGASIARVRRGTFRVNNSAGTDAITQANVGQNCYLVDNTTVALTDGGQTRLLAGKVIRIDTLGVYVEFGLTGAGTVPGVVGEQSFAIDFAALSALALNAIAIGPVVMKNPGRIIGAYLTVGKPTTTGAKASSLQVATTVAGSNGGAKTALAGGNIVLTSANTNALPDIVQGSAITQNSQSKLAVGDTYELDVSLATAPLTEGSGTVHVVFG